MIKNINKIISLFFKILSLILGVLAIFLLLFLDFESIKSGSSSNTSDTVYIINGYTAIFGGNNIEILNGYFSGGNFISYLPSTIVKEIRFDYIAFIGIIISLISLFLMVIFYDRKFLLLMSILINVFSLILLINEPYSFCFVNQGLETLSQAYSCNGRFILINIGVLAAVSIFAVIDIFYLCRFFILLFKKVTID